MMNELVKTVKNGKPVKGVKEPAWWQFITLKNYLVPLLYELTGIGNDVYDNFKDVVNEDIERLDPKEITTRRKVLLCERAIKYGVAKRADWDASTLNVRIWLSRRVLYTDALQPSRSWV